MRSQVNNIKAGGHEATTKVLRTAQGKIIIDLYRVNMPEPGSPEAIAQALHGPDHATVHGSTVHG